MVVVMTADELAAAPTLKNSAGHFRYKYDTDTGDYTLDGIPIVVIQNEWDVSNLIVITAPTSPEQGKE